ncbi:MAG TPA: adenosine deaminase [Anaerolineae bacterium]|nr:adenosine deaminase [Anaerolineae bacterium]
MPAHTSWFERVPKVELHVHLEGAIPLETTWDLVQKYGGDPSLPNIEALRRRFVFRDFPHFIDTWIWRNQFLREYEDFAVLAEAVARDLASQNIRYVEAFFSPADYFRHGLQTQDLLTAVRSGLNRVPDIVVALVADLVRDTGPERAMVTLREVNEVRSHGVIGIGIGGSEQTFPPESFEEVYREARRLGLHTSAHAGEAAGAASIWGAIRALKVERIGHGTRAEEDPELLDYLVETQLPLEMCPLSNLRTGVVRSLDEHPVGLYYRRGLMVTVNSDDPKLFGSSLAEEYRLLMEHHSFSRADVRAVVLNAVRASWLPGDRKQELLQSIGSDPVWGEPSA